MGEAFDGLRQELLSLYEVERDSAVEQHNLELAERLSVAQGLVSRVECKAELLQLLVEQCIQTLAPIEQAKTVGEILKAHGSDEELALAGIFIDLPDWDQVKWNGMALLINTLPERYRLQVDQDGQVAFLGAWTVDARRASVIALTGALFNLRYCLATAQIPSDNASVVQLPDGYYQPIARFDRPNTFRKLERIFVEDGRFWLLDRLKEQVWRPTRVDLLAQYETPILKKGDDLVAEDAHCALVRNAHERSYMLYLIRNEREIVQAIQACQHDCLINEDLRPLKASLIRDEFLKWPGGRRVIGKNHLGEEVSLSFDVGFQDYKPHNLYRKGVAGKWEPYTTPIRMSGKLTLEAEIQAIQRDFAPCLKAEALLDMERHPGWKR